MCTRIYVSCLGMYICMYICMYVYVYIYIYIYIMLRNLYAMSCFSHVFFMHVFFMHVCVAPTAISFLCVCTPGPHSGRYAWLERMQYQLACACMCCCSSAHNIILSHSTSSRVFESMKHTMPSGWPACVDEHAHIQCKSSSYGMQMLSNICAMYLTFMSTAFFYVYAKVPWFSVCFLHMHAANITATMQQWWIVHRDAETPSPRHPDRQGTPRQTWRWRVSRACACLWTFLCPSLYVCTDLGHGHSKCRCPPMFWSHAKVSVLAKTGKKEPSSLGAKRPHRHTHTHTPIPYFSMWKHSRRAYSTEVQVILCAVRRAHVKLLSNQNCSCAFQQPRKGRWEERPCCCADADIPLHDFG